MSDHIEHACPKCGSLVCAGKCQPVAVCVACGFSDGHHGDCPAQPGSPISTEAAALVVKQNTADLLTISRRTVATQHETIETLQEQLRQYESTFNLQLQRTEEAVAAWREDTGREDVQPDLGELLGWLLKERSAGQDAMLRAQELQAALYVPGMWECPTCNFTQINQTVHPNGIAPNMEQEKRPCPNRACDGAELRRLTWRKANEHASIGCGSQLARALDAETELQKARGAAHEYETRCRRLQKEIHLMIAVVNAAQVLNDNSHREQNIYGIGDLRDALRHFKRQHIPQSTGAALADVRRVVAVFRDGGLNFQAMKEALDAMPLPAEPPASIVHQLLALFCLHSIDMVETHAQVARINELFTWGVPGHAYTNAHHKVEALIKEYESAAAAEKDLRRISEQLCGVPVEGEVKLSDVYHFVEGTIEKESDLRERAEGELAKLHNYAVEMCIVAGQELRDITVAELMKRFTAQVSEANFGKPS